MAAPRSVVDLLAEQSEDALREMRDSVQAELARLTVEVQQIDQALAKKGRRRRTGGGKLHREQVLELVVGAGRPLTPAEVHELVTASGITATLNAVRNHLTRLAEQDRLLARFPDGRFGRPFVPAPDEPDFDEPEPPQFEPEPDLSRGDIPF